MSMSEWMRSNIFFNTSFFNKRFSLVTTTFLNCGCSSFRAKINLLSTYICPFCNLISHCLSSRRFNILTNFSSIRMVRIEPVVFGDNSSYSIKLFLGLYSVLVTRKEFFSPSKSVHLRASSSPISKLVYDRVVNIKESISNPSESVIRKNLANFSF